jgi:hypothetical protein
MMMAAVVEEVSAGDPPNNPVPLGIGLLKRFQMVIPLV